VRYFPDTDMVTTVFPAFSPLPLTRGAPHQPPLSGDSEGVCAHREASSLGHSGETTPKHISQTLTGNTVETAVAPRTPQGHAGAGRQYGTRRKEKTMDGAAAQALTSQLVTVGDQVINVGDTAFMMICAALVLLMTPGLALFYAGMVRKKNVLSTTMHSFFAMGLVTVLWALVGYSIAFGSAEGPLGKFLGGFNKLGLTGVANSVFGIEGHLFPESVFAMYQCMFAIITVGLITGAIAERMKFKAYVVFAAAWVILVYSPLAHWVWGGGWLGAAGVGALDFAGGTVVHIASAAAALACALVLGRRKDAGTSAIQPHNLPMTLLGAGILWFGWFGFNAGSELAVDSVAGSAFMVTHLAAAAAMLGWLLVETIQHGKPTTLGAASGAVAGLVAITPAAGFVDAGPGMIIGALAGIACYFGVQMKNKFGFDDALDVVGIHGVGGTLGALLTGVFASKAVSGAVEFLGGTDGLLYGGGFTQLGRQAVGIAAAWAFSFVLSFIILKVIDAVMGVRVDADAEETGLDLADHAEAGYVL
jgi:Amt family ammonium transporter